MWKRVHLFAARYSVIHGLLVAGLALKYACQWYMIARPVAAVVHGQGDKETAESSVVLPKFAL